MNNKIINHRVSHNLHIEEDQEAEDQEVRGVTEDTQVTEMAGEVRPVQQSRVQ